LKKHTATFANSGLPYPLHVSERGVEKIELPGVPLGSFPSSTYDEYTVDLTPGDLFVFCSDGISETFNEAGEEFGSARVGETALDNLDKSAKEIVEAIFGTMQAFRGAAEQTDDQTVVVVKITA
jgi:sigma-B regulation protein RsbU (phosphoserine phosphatase)